MYSFRTILTSNKEKTSYVLEEEKSNAKENNRKEITGLSSLIAHLVLYIVSSQKMFLSLFARCKLLFIS